MDQLRDFLNAKVNAAPAESILRYDVFQYSVIPSLIQQEGI